MRPPEFVTEAEFEKAWVMLASHHGWSTMHVKKASNRTPTSISGVLGTSGKGWPDRVIWHHQHGVLFIESKMNNGTVSGEQREVINSLTEAGARCRIFKPKMWAEIESILRSGEAF